MATSLRLIPGECIEVMRSLPDASVDAIITDPPYGLEFMGKEWDRFKPADARIRMATARDEERGDAQDGLTTRMRGKPEAYAAGSPFQDWCRQWASEAFRVLKPGGHLLAFGGTRTYHRLACGIEDAGFDIRDNGALLWVYGEGFPKSHNISKAIDEEAGVERPVVGERTDGVGNTDASIHKSEGFAASREKTYKVTGPATEDAKRWQGWGTALKPAWEPIVIARKPPVGTIAGNMLKFGVGGLNIDACRIGFASDADEAESKDKNRHEDFGSGARENKVYGADARTRAESGGNYSATGRWPANLILSHAEGCVRLGVKVVEGAEVKPLEEYEPNNKNAVYGKGMGGGAHPGFGSETVENWACVGWCPVRLLDEQSGDRPSTLTGRADGPAPNPGFAPKRNSDATSFPVPDRGTTTVYADSGGASRFFYCAKAPGHERWAFCRPCKKAVSPATRDDHAKHCGPGEFVMHPTQKPVEVMRWLIRLLVPKGAVVLDPFNGSGTTGEAAYAEGVNYIGIEKDPDSQATTTARFTKIAEHSTLF